MIAVVDYGIGNLGSAYKALTKIGVEAVLVDRPIDLSNITGLVVPGVGSFGACMNALRSKGLEDTILDSVGANIPILGICVGMQMLYEGSEESPGIAGLGLLKGYVAKITNAPKLPHMSWNQIKVIKDGENFLFRNLPLSPWFYFVHSYAPRITEDSLAMCDYGDGFGAVAAKGNILGTQFHPEKSSFTGLKLLANFVEYTNSEMAR